MAAESQGYQHALCLRAAAIVASLAACITASAQQPQLSFNGRFVINTNAAFPQVRSWVLPRLGAVECMYASIHPLRCFRKSC